MRSFLCVAALAASVAAVKDYGSYTNLHTHEHEPIGADHTHYDEEDKVHHHHHPVVHVDVWDTITADLDALTAGNQSLVDAQAIAAADLMTLTNQYSALMQSIIDAQNSTNIDTGRLAEEKVQDDVQDASIAALTADISKVEDNCRDLENMTTLFGMVIDSLPDYSSLQARLDLIVDKNVTLKAATVTNDSSITGIADDVVDGNTALAAINQSITGAEGSLDPLNAASTGEIAVNLDAIAADAAALALIKADFDMQTISFDHFFSNAAAIVTADTTGLPVAIPAAVATDSEFCANNLETVEFHLAATTIAEMTADDGDITGIFLWADGVVVAASTHKDTITLGGRSRSHTLFYKETLAANTKFTVAWSSKAIANAGTPASIAANNLQWGVKTYAAGYELAATPTAVCI